MEIRRYQRNTDLLIPKVPAVGSNSQRYGLQKIYMTLDVNNYLLQMPFSRVIREIAQSLCSTKDLRFQSTAIMCLQVQQQMLSATNDEKLWIVNKFTGSC